LDIESTAVEVLDSPRTDNYAIAVNKKTLLTEQINSAIAELAASGEIRRS
jgi:ABC-type amino acid transport substrate-binding protein